MSKEETKAQVENGTNLTNLNRFYQTKSQKLSGEL